MGRPPALTGRQQAEGGEHGSAAGAEGGSGDGLAEKKENWLDRTTHGMGQGATKTFVRLKKKKKKKTR